MGYNTTPPSKSIVPPAPTTPAFPFTVHPQQSPPDIHLPGVPDPMVMELCRQVYLAKVGASPQQHDFMPHHLPSPTIPGSRVFSGARKSNSSTDGSSLGSPAVKLHNPPTPYHRPAATNFSHHFDKLPSPLQLSHIAPQQNDKISDMDQETLLHHLLQLMHLDQSQEIKLPYTPLLPKPIRDSPDFGKRFNDFNR